MCCNAIQTRFIANTRSQICPAAENSCHWIEIAMDVIKEIQPATAATEHPTPSPDGTHRTPELFSHPQNFEPRISEPERG
jgi:hypothetical protein